MKAIVAMDLNRVIGYKGKIPWHIPEDLKWFKKMTSDPAEGGGLVIGNSTFRSMGLLPNRYTYILTSTPEKYQYDSTKQCRFISVVDFHRFELDNNQLWLAGGAKAYEALIHHCSEVFVTIVLDEYHGDTFMPEFEPFFPNSKILKETKKFWIVKYWK